ncbi:hypothetical protein C2845_PM08G23690 [Panicum miliaceum]|uniref:Uncharacterized protein n=1 Tax=Panicum miliaceum TaxID=4540 RepID=A0A3L6QX01_PANMI|nr:hypothetical protein C2845_PM08G23690 [Panicum miliaceum]
MDAHKEQNPRRVSDNTNCTRGVKGSKTHSRPHLRVHTSIVGSPRSHARIYHGLRAFGELATRLLGGGGGGVVPADEEHAEAGEDGRRSHRPDDSGYGGRHQRGHPLREHDRQGGGEGPYSCLHLQALRRARGQPLEDAQEVEEEDEVDEGHDDKQDGAGVAPRVVDGYPAVDREEAEGDARGPCRRAIGGSGGSGVGLGAMVWRI